MNDDDKQAQACLEQGMTPRCPAFCVSEHAVAIAEGCEPFTLYQHIGTDYGAGLFELVSPYDGRVLRAGKKNWHLGLEKTQSVNNGWDSMAWATLSLSSQNDGTMREVSMRMTSGELRDLSAALLKVADQMD